MSKVISDEKARDLIISEVGTNYFVEASAGSGKTTSLVYRMVKMVEKGFDVSKICTITFTKAAADEFFSRFQKLLSIRSVDIEDDTEKYLGKRTKDSMENCAKALANIDACFLGTIDSFCNMIAHELPTELGVPSDSEIISNEERSDAIKEEYEKILKDRNHQLHKYALRFKDLFYPHYDCFATAINTISEIRNMDIIFDESLVDIDIEDYLKNEKDIFISLVKALLKQKIVFDLAERQKKYDSLKFYYKKLINNDWNNIIPIVHKAASTVKGIGIYPKSLDNTDLTFDGILVKKPKSSNFELAEEYKTLLDQILLKIENYKHSLCLYLAREASEDIACTLKASGKFQFYDFLYYTNEAFKKSSATNRKLVDHILERHSYFLLDESQDTNPMQTEMFFYLTGTVKTDDWTKTEPREGSLFIVGDPKQSIYAFRGANVQAYKKTREIFKAKDEYLVLTKNFRSNTDLKDWFNSSMNDLLNRGEDALEHINIPVSDEEHADFDAIPTEPNVDILDGVYKYISTEDDDPENIAKLITDLVGNEQKKIIIRDKGVFKTRTIEYKDFMLVPMKTKVEKLVEALDKYQIPMLIEAKIPFDKAASLEALTNLVFLLKNPQDVPSFMKVVYSSLYALNDLDIIKMRNDGFNFDISNIEGLSLTKQEHIDIVKELNALYIATKEMTYSSMMLFIINNKDFKLFKKVDTNFLEYTYFVIEKTKEKEEAGLISNIEEFRKFIDHFYNAPADDKENRVLRFVDEIDRVKISNLHKVKGLQAPIVILIKPREKKYPATKYIDYNSNTPKAYFSEIDIQNSHGAIVPMIKTDMFKDDLGKWTEYAEAEKYRLQYVAATRAESVLFVAKGADKITDSKYDPWKELTDRISTSEYPVPDVPVPAPKQPEDIGYANTCVDESCNNASTKYHSPSKAAHDIKSAPVDNNLDEIVEETNDDATTIGTIVHRLMECLVTSKNSYSDIDALIDTIVDEYNAYGYRDMLKEVYNQMSSGGYPQKNSNVEQDILNKLMTAKDVRCELPFSYQKYNVIVNGVIDLLYEDESGYHIIDYKTNKEDDVSILEVEYEKQLQDYVEALREIGIKADAHIYHINAK